MRSNKVKRSHWLLYNMLFFTEHVLGHKFYRKIFGKIEKRLYTAIDRYASSVKEPDNFRIIEYKEGDEGWDKPQYHPYYPVIYRGAAKDWPCTRKWSLAFFADKYGDEEITLFSNKGLLGHNTVQDFDTITLREYISMLKAGSKKYLKFSRVVDGHSSLKADINIDYLEKFLQPGSFSKLFFFFMGGKNTMTPIHNGFQPTVFVQLEGEKKWIFYPLVDRLFLGVRPERTNYYFTAADINNPDDPNFPLLKHASPHELTLYPGDIMYFPSFVWHQVENVTDAIGIAYKFVHPYSAFRSSKMMFTLFFLATQPFFLYSMIMTRLKKKDPVFLKKQKY